MMTTQPLRVVEANGKRRPLRKKLTAAYCRDVSPPTAGRLTVYDNVTPGLALVVTAKASRAFYLIRKVDGRARRVRLADGTIPVEQARKMAAQETVNLNNGIDPIQVRRVRRAKVETLGGLYDVYAAERQRTPRTVAADDSQWGLIKSWHRHRLDSITPEMAAALHSKIGNDPKRGRTSANRTLQLVRRLYRFARKRRLYRGENPVEGMDFYPEQSRERFVKPAELPRLLKSIDKAPAPFPDYFRLLLLTGARRSAMAAMRWDDVDLTAGTWSIPAADSKNKRGIVVPLVPDAVKRLKRLRKEADDDAAHVFPNKRKNAKTPHLVNPYEQWRLIRDRAKLSDLTMHDLRRTCGSYLAAAGVSLPVIGRALGHRSQTSTAIYARLDVADVRAELAHVSAAVDAADGKAKRTTKKRTRKA